MKISFKKLLSITFVSLSIGSSASAMMEEKPDRFVAFVFGPETKTAKRLAKIVQEALYDTRKDCSDLLPNNKPYGTTTHGYSLEKCVDGQCFLKEYNDKLSSGKKEDKTMFFSNNEETQILESMNSINLNNCISVVDPLFLNSVKSSIHDTTGQGQPFHLTLLSHTKGSGNTKSSANGIFEGVSDEEIVNFFEEIKNFRAGFPRAKMADDQLFGWGRFLAIPLSLNPDMKKIHNFDNENVDYTKKSNNNNYKAKKKENNNNNNNNNNNKKNNNNIKNKENNEMDNLTKLFDNNLAFQNKSQNVLVEKKQNLTQEEQEEQEKNAKILKNPYRNQVLIKNGCQVSDRIHISLAQIPALKQGANFFNNKTTQDAIKTHTAKFFTKVEQKLKEAEAKGEQVIDMSEGYIQINYYVKK